MLFVGLSVSGEEVVQTLRDRSFMVRAPLANLVLVPVLGLVLVMLLAVAPGGVNAIQFSGKVCGKVASAITSLFILTIISLVVTPIVAKLIPFHNEEVLIPAHPDQAGGLGFLGITQIWFAPFVLGLASVNASVLANQILYEGATLVSFMPQIILFVGVILLVILGPLLIFSPKMIIAKRRGLLEYATLASSFVRAFDRRWLKGPEIGEEQLLGNADFSAHADLGATFTNLRGMKIAPIDLITVLFFLGAALLPMLPLLLLAFTPEQIFGVIKGIFL